MAPLAGEVLPVPRPTDVLLRPNAKPPCPNAVPPRPVEAPAPTAVESGLGARARQFALESRSVLAISPELQPAWAAAGQARTPATTAQPASHPLGDLQYLRSRPPAPASKARPAYRRGPCAKCASSLVVISAPQKKRPRRDSDARGQGGRRASTDRLRKRAFAPDQADPWVTFPRGVARPTQPVLREEFGFTLHPAI